MNRELLLCVAASVLSLAHHPTIAHAQAAIPDAKPGQTVVSLELDGKILDMDRLKASRMGYMPAGLKFVEEKPAGIVKEPNYLGKPRYGAFRVGNGPRNITLTAIDEPEGKPGKFYVDSNQNGDLTDDGPGDWEQSKVVDGITKYMTTLTVHASWGTPLTEELSGSYTLMAYKNHGDAGGGYTTLTGRSGKLTLGEKTYSVVLHEGTNDGLFTVPATGDTTRRPVELCVDLDGDGTFKGMIKQADGKELKYPERFFLSDPFEIDGQWYIGRPNISGRWIVLSATQAPGANVAAAREPVEVIRMPAVSSVAPDFTVQTPEGKPISLADFKGKVVILDFWATWCGPCQAAMPGLEKIYQGIKDQDVAVFSVSVWDEKEAFDQWIAKNSGTKYNFTFGFDPLGRDKGNVAASKYGVTGIPTAFVIDREGKVAASFVGGGNDEGITKALVEQGIKVDRQ